MVIPYPPECDTDEKKLQWCLAMMEKLRAEHNETGATYKTWLMSRLLHQQWQNFLVNWFQPRHDKLTAEILRLREALRQKPITEDPDDL